MGEGTFPYEDIVGLAHHVSVRHPQMARSDRAAQFAPFAALTGHGAAVQETARLTKKRMELDEEHAAQINSRLRLLREYIGEQPEVTVTYFIPDARKEGGSYAEVTGTVTRLDAYRRTMTLDGEICVPLEEIVALESGYFCDV